MESIICKLATGEISIFQLVSVAEETGLKLALSETPKTGFLTTRPMGAQWLSGRVFNSRPKGRGFEPHRRHCVVVLEQDTFILG